MMLPSSPAQELSVSQNAIPAAADGSATSTTLPQTPDLESGSHLHLDGSPMTDLVHSQSDNSTIADPNTDEKSCENDVIGNLRGNRRSHLRSDLVGRSENELQDVPRPGQRKE
jgi:hypothetical protein